MITAIDVDAVRDYICKADRALPKEQQTVWKIGVIDSVTMARLDELDVEFNPDSEEAKVRAKDLDFVVFYDKPFVKFERILKTYLAYAPFGFRSFSKALPLWIKQKIWTKELIKEELDYQGKILFIKHHQSHAASAFFPSPFKEAAFITIDGVGEWATASFGVGVDNKIEIFKELHFPHSLGLLYSAFTYYTGFKVNSGEYKLIPNSWKYRPGFSFGWRPKWGFILVS